MQHEYTDKMVTPWGGMQEMKELLDKTGISKKMVEIGLPPEGKSNNKIEGIEIVESFFVSMWIGCHRFSQTAVVRVDEVLRQIFGWKRVASGTTFGRFFKRFTPSVSNPFFEQLYGWFFDQLIFDNYTLDVDSSVITRYGEQEGALKGYNPKKPGRNSHHPLFAFVSDLRMVANCWLRSGNTNSSSNCIHFLEETFRILKHKTIGLFRADSGFCTAKILEFMEERRISYVIAVPMYANLQRQIYDIKNWNAIGLGLFINEIEYQQGGWNKARRIVVIRQQTEVRKKATGKKIKQKSLFEGTTVDQEKLYTNRYHCFVSNQSLPAIQIWEQYKQRGDCENRIKELKEDFGVEGFCMNDFAATEAAMRLVTIGYNLMSLFKQLTHRTKAQPTLSTLRFNCFAVGSWVTIKGNSKILKMSVPLKRRQWYDGIFREMENIQLPLSLTG